MLVVQVVVAIIGIVICIHTVVHPDQSIEVQESEDCLWMR